MFAYVDNRGLRIIINLQSSWVYSGTVGLEGCIEGSDQALTEYFMLQAFWYQMLDGKWVANANDFKADHNDS